MEGAQQQELVQHSQDTYIGKQGEPTLNDHEDSKTSIGNNKFNMPKLIHYKWWLRVTTYIIFLLAGQTSATLLGRLYFDKGGNSKWMATFVQSAGFPIILPLLFFFPKPSSCRTTLNCRTQVLLYFALGLLLTGDNLMYSYGLVYLPVSTYSLLCATQLAFNAITSFFINSQKFTMLVLNALVLLSISACLLAINADNEGVTNISRVHYIIGFLCTIGASATYALNLSLIQFSFEKVLKSETFNSVLSMQVYTSVVATTGCIIGLFASGEWKTLNNEMHNFTKGKVSYVMTLTWTAINWQITSIGILGLIFEVSSLFSNVIGTLSLPMIPVFAVVFFHDKMSGVKIVSLVLAVWGFVSYVYQHYLDDRKGTKLRAMTTNTNHVPVTTTEMC